MAYVNIHAKNNACMRRWKGERPVNHFLIRHSMINVGKKGTKNAAL